MTTIIDERAAIENENALLRGRLKRTYLRVQMAEAERDAAQAELAAVREQHAAELATIARDWQSDVGTLTARAQTAEARAAKAEAERDEAKALAFYAFVNGAAWWQFHEYGATMFQSERRLAEEEAKKRYPYAPHPLMVMAKSERDSARAEADALRAAMQIQDERISDAGNRVDLYFGCDTPERMADEIIAMRARVAELEAR